MATTTKEKPVKTKTVEKKEPALNNTIENVDSQSVIKKKASLKTVASDKAPTKSKKTTAKIGKAKAFNPEIIEKLKKIISPYTEHPELLKHIEKDTNVNFVEKLNIDSVDVVEIVVDVEQEFNITIADKEIETFKTFEDMYNLIEAKINETSIDLLAKAI